jgi:amino acid permease
MDTSFIYYVFILIAIIIGVLVVKKITSCLIKSIVLVVLVAILAFLYFAYYQAG